ncbi:MAG: hypothetical protein AAGA30_17840, partial [Planctomycetota bacterium]
MSKSRRKSFRTGLSPDPFVRAFLNQAIAIIRTEKGFNDAANSKLIVLAKQLEISERDFQDCISKLKEPDQKFGQNHYEKQYSKRLFQELALYKHDVLNIRAEQQLVRLAENQYQINPIRAHQL